MMNVSTYSSTADCVFNFRKVESFAATSELVIKAYALALQTFVWDMFSAVKPISQYRIVVDVLWWLLDGLGIREAVKVYWKE